MTKRVLCKYGICSQYRKDFWGVLFLTCKTMHFLKEIKEKQESRRKFRERKRLLLKRKQVIKKGRFKFSFRVDNPNPRKKAPRRKTYRSLLENRHKLRMFASAMTLHTFRRISFKMNNVLNFFSSSFFYFFETRLDIFLFRLNLIYNGNKGRQLINHGFVKVNGKLITAPSFKIRKYDIVSFLKPMKVIKYVKSKFKCGLVFFSLPSYIETNYRIMICLFWQLPKNKKFYFFPCHLKLVMISTRKRFTFY